MSTIRILPFGDKFQAVETDGVAKTLITAVFPTKEEAQRWAQSRFGAIDRLEQAITREQTSHARLTTLLRAY